jgi:hypothetical protein
MILGYTFNLDRLRKWSHTIIHTGGSIQIVFLFFLMINKNALVIVNKDFWTLMIKFIILHIGTFRCRINKKPQLLHVKHNFKAYTNLRETQHVIVSKEYTMHLFTSDTSTYIQRNCYDNVHNAATIK